MHRLGDRLRHGGRPVVRRPRRPIAAADRRPQAPWARVAARDLCRSATAAVALAAGEAQTRMARSNMPPPGVRQGTRFASTGSPAGGLNRGLEQALGEVLLSTTVGARRALDSCEPPLGSSAASASPLAPTVVHLVGDRFLAQLRTFPVFARLFRPFPGEQPPPGSAPVNLVCQRLGQA